MSATSLSWPRFLLFALVLNLLLAGSVGSGKALACSCAVSGSFSEQAQRDLRKADVVFSGEAVEVERPSSPSEVGQPGATTFDAEAFWKGAPSEQVVVHDQGGPASSCNVAFEEGERYLVYAYREDEGEGDRLRIGACDMTHPLHAAMFDLDVLGPSLAGLPETGGPVYPTVGWGGVSAALLLLSALGVGALHLRRRRLEEPR